MHIISYFTVVEYYGTRPYAAALAYFYRAYLHHPVFKKVRLRAAVFIQRSVITQLHQVIFCYVGSIQPHTLPGLNTKQPENNGQPRRSFQEVEQKRNRQRLERGSDSLRAP